MAKKKFFGMAKNDKANMPQEVVMSSYPKYDYALSDDMYVDTQPELDREYDRSKSKVKRGMRK